jgi:hypothetical protein
MATDRERNDEQYPGRAYRPADQDPPRGSRDDVRSIADERGGQGGHELGPEDVDEDDLDEDDVDDDDEDLDEEEDEDEEEEEDEEA